MKRVWWVLFSLAASSLHGQVLPPASGPVRMGHLHIISASPEAQKRFWTEGLGAIFVSTEAYDVYKVPGVLVVVQKGSERQGTAGSVVNHIGLRVRDLKAAVSKCKAAGAEIESENAKQAMVIAPDRIRVELTFDDTLTTPVANHHIHLYGPDPNQMRNWYSDYFGATPGMRGPFQAADLPGVNLSFSQTDSVLAGTEGRALDHIGFEVHDLEAFTHQLELNGLKLAVPYRQVPSLGIAIAFVRDPWGTYIELTEGLDRLP